MIPYESTANKIIKNKKIAEIFNIRSRVIRAIREYFWKNDFIEVDTPILRGYEDPTDNAVFTTTGPRGWPRLHLRTCHEEFVRRTLSLHPKVYEIGKAFRNEDIISPIHLPEFQLLEHYEISSDPKIALSRIQEIIKYVSTILINEYDNTECLDYSLLKEISNNPFKMVKVEDKIKSFWYKSKSSCNNWEKISKNEKRDMCERYIESDIRPSISSPTFLCDFPEEVNVFTYKYRAELDIRGLEIGECVILGNDTDNLKSHCKKALLDRHGAYSDKFLLDTIYLDEIKNYPIDAAGGGFCIDRLLMVITKEKDINNVVWHPFKRKRGEIS